jgi:hypothetical protein
LTTGAHKKPPEHVPNHAGDLSRETGHLRAAVAKRRGRPPAAPIFFYRGGFKRKWTKTYFPEFKAHLKTRFVDIGGLVRCSFYNKMRALAR